MSKFFSSQIPPKHTLKENVCALSLQEATVQKDADLLCSRQTSEESVKETEKERQAIQEISPPSSDGMMSLKRLYAHYATKQLHPPPSPLLEDLGLEAAAAEATASYAAWKKMQDRFAQFLGK